MITSWPELADGTYNVMTWDGTTSSIQESVMTVANGRTSSLAGAVFCVADQVMDTQTYKVQSLAFDEEGNLEVEAIHWPTDQVGVSVISDGWNVDGNWVIEGEVGDTDSPVELDPEFTNVSIIGPNLMTVGEAEGFAAIVDGPNGDYVYQWDPAGTSGTNPGTALEFDAVPPDGFVEVSVTVTLGDVTRTATTVVTVVA